MKQFLLLAAMLLAPALCWGQQTTIQATVTDPTGRPYTFLTGNASIQCPGNQQPTFNGSPLQRTISITGGDGNGHFTQVLWDVNAILPLGCSWRWAITWSDGITNFITGNIGGVTGPGPVNLSAAISAFSVPLPAAAGAVGSVAATAPIVATPNPIIGAGTISCPTCGTVTGSAASPRVAFWSSPTALSGDPQFTWADGTNALGIFQGPAVSTLSANLQGFTSSPPSQSVTTFHAVTGSTSTTSGVQMLLQSDATAGADGLSVILDETNYTTGAVNGSEFITFMNVPMGVTNSGDQASVVAGISAYGTGTLSAPVAAFEAVNDIPGAGTVSDLSGYRAVTDSIPFVGTATNYYGFKAEDLLGRGTALNAAYNAQAQTAGANNWGFFSDSSNKDHFGSLFSGTDNTTAGSLTIANGAANAHTIWSSAATTSNTIKGFATAPATGHAVTCTTAGTVCTLTDGGVAPTLGTAVMKKGTNAGDYSSASASYTNVDGTNLSYTTTIAVGTNLVIQASFVIDAPAVATSVTTKVGLADGGTIISGPQTSFQDSNGDPSQTSASLLWLIAGDGASHTITLQYEKLGGSASNAILLNSGGVIPVMIFSLQ